jgi:hypothetical protein
VTTDDIFYRRALFSVRNWHRGIHLSAFFACFSAFFLLISKKHADLRFQELNFELREVVMYKVSVTFLLAALALLFVMSPLLANTKAVGTKYPGAQRLVAAQPVPSVERISIPGAQLPLQIETILLVDDDGSPNNGGTYFGCEDSYTAALGDAGYAFDNFVVDWSITSPPQNGPDAATMASYDCVIWFTGETWGYYGVDVLTAADETNLATYLAGGGTLFLNAQDYLWASYPNAGPLSPGQFPYDYLGVASASQDIFAPPTSVAGATGGYAEGLQYTCLNPFPSATLWSDQLNARAQAQKLLNANGTQTALAVQYDGGPYYTAFSTCGLEGLVDGASLVSTYMDAILTGFGATGVIAQQEPVVVTGYLLNQNYPNPFNPTTEIQYQLPVNGKVTLTVYNMLGEEIATLIDDNQSAGAYRITWNATDLPSGMYFYQLKTNNFQDVRRMLLLK